MLSTSQKEIDLLKEISGIKEKLIEQDKLIQDAKEELNDAKG